MANKPFAIQGADLTLGGVNLQAGTTGVVIPGATQAVNYLVKEVDEMPNIGGQDLGSDETAVTVIDNAEYLYLVDDGDSPSADYVAATYSVDELDELGNIKEMVVETEGVFLDADKTRAEASDMWATLDATPFTSFTAGNWIQIPFRPKMRAGEVENIGGGGNANTGNFTFSDDTIANDNGLLLDTNRGSLAIGTNMETPGVAGHFHIAFNGSNNNPPVNDLFLGDDHNYVKLPGSQLNPATYGVEIGTDNRNLGPQNIEVSTVDELVPPGGVWRFFISPETYPNLGSLVSVGDTVTTSWGTPITATITDVIEDPGLWWIVAVAQDITAGFSGYDTVSFGSSGISHTWRFGTDGTLTIPGDETITDTKVTNWDTAYEWGDHSIAGYLTSVPVASASVLGGVKLGEGFSTAVDNKVTTNKLYSTNLTQPTQHYRLELDTNGVVVLPDQSIINGSTLRGVYGTGEANYTGITIGPDAEHREESWMYVDHTGSYIATQYNTNQKLWQFKNDGSTILPSGAGFVKGDNGQLKVNDGTTLALDLRDSSGRGFYTNGDGFSLRGDGDSTWKFGTNGTLTLPQYDTAISQYDGETTFDGGTDDIGVQVNVDKTIYLRVGDNNWVFGAGAGGANILQLPAGGEITSAAGTGDVVIEANDGTARTWTFGSTGDLVLPGNTSSIKNTNGTLYKVAPNYGSFYDTTTQTNTSVGNAIPISYNTTDINNGITITGTGNTEIRIATAGTYNIQFSLQLRKTDGGADTVYIWLDKNGTRVDNSATNLYLVGSNAADVAAWNFVVNATANDYYRLMWMSTDSHVEIVAVTAGAVVPAIPSVILTVVPVGT